MAKTRRPSRLLGVRGAILWCGLILLAFGVPGDPAPAGDAGAAGHQSRRSIAMGLRGLGLGPRPPPIPTGELRGLPKALFWWSRMLGDLLEKTRDGMDSELVGLRSHKSCVSRGSNSPACSSSDMRIRKVLTNRFEAKTRARKN